MPRRPSIAALAAALFALAASAAAETPKAPANDDCLACHGDPAAARENGRSVAVDPGAFAASIHGSLGMACVDCHTDLAAVGEFPHAEKLAPVNCGTCHADAVKLYASSIHAKARQSGMPQAATCVDCHGLHDIRQKTDAGSRTYSLNIADTCGRCHGPKGAPGAPAVMTAFKDSIHGQALTAKGLVVAPNCASCHGSHDIHAHTEPASHVFRTNVVGTCTRCHEGIRPQYEASIHAEQVKAGNPLAPVCSDCHTAHGIAATESARWQLGIIRECGTCHEQSLRTYRDTFHGRVTELGFTRVAKCADCHGAHGILPASNPRSTVSPARRLRTCQTCHPRANANFARYDPHADPRDRARNPTLHYASVFMKTLLTGVFLFFGVHTLLWIPRAWQLRRDRAARGPRGEA